MTLKDRLDVARGRLEATGLARRRFAASFNTLPQGASMHLGSSSGHDHSAGWDNWNNWNNTPWDNWNNWNNWPN